MFDRLIVITAPGFFEGEADILNQLFEAGLKRLHLRKPLGGRGELERLVSEIDPNFRKRVAVHYHQGLVTELGLGGMHFSYHASSNPADLSDEYTVSCSLHSWGELEKVQEKIDYCFMGPVFNSISKLGYLANEALQDVPGFARNVFALGGINEANCNQVLSIGYTGVAVLGALWEDKEQALQRFTALQGKVKAHGN